MAVNFQLARRLLQFKHLAQLCELKETPEITAQARRILERKR